MGSKGRSHQAYSIQIPVATSPETSLAIESGVCFAYEGVHIEITPLRNGYAFVIGEFASAITAWFTRLPMATGSFESTEFDTEEKSTAELYPQSATRP